MRIIKEHTRLPRLSRAQYREAVRASIKRGRQLNAARMQAEHEDTRADSIDHIVDRLLRGHIMR